MGAVWAERGLVYQTGVVMVVLSTLAFTTGQLAPFWVTVDSEVTANDSARHVGLWFECQAGECVTHSFSTDRESLKATRILQVLGLLTLMTSLLVVCFANCRRHHPGSSFFLEAVVALGAILGFSGGIVYLCATMDRVTTSPFIHYDWAFAINIAASVLAFIAAVVIFIANVLHNRRHPDIDPATLKHCEGQKSGKLYVDGSGYCRSQDGRSTPAILVPPRDYNHDPAVFYGQGSFLYPPVDGLGPSRSSGRRSRGGSDAGFPEKRVTSSGESIGNEGRVGVDFVDEDRPSQPRVFMLPRVVVRGYYEPGFGYPEYVMM